MATSNKAGGRFPKDPLVAALVPDASSGPPDATVLHGYLGESTRPGTCRLYLDATLASYVEVSESDILHHKQVPDDGGTMLWVPKSLELKVTTVSSATIQAEFLSGAIAVGRMKAAGRASAPAGARAVASVGCPSILNSCVSRILACPSDGCPTWSNCPPTPTVIDWCAPSQFAPLCTIFGF